MQKGGQSGYDARKWTPCDENLRTDLLLKQNTWSL